MRSSANAGKEVGAQPMMRSRGKSAFSAAFVILTVSPNCSTNDLSEYQTK